MGAVERTREVVESRLATLADRYDTYSVNQSTLAVSAERYQRERADLDSGRLVVYTKVRNEASDVLHLDGDAPELPSKAVDAVDEIEPAAREAVAEQVGVQCTLGDLDQATILGLRNAADEECETIYSLAVVFEATHEAGAVTDEAVWEPSPNHEAMFA